MSDPKYSFNITGNVNGKLKNTYTSKYNYIISQYHPITKYLKKISVKFQLPPANPRPELGLHRFSGPFSTDHHYQQTVQQTGKIYFPIQP